MKRWIWMILLSMAFYPTSASSDPPDGKHDRAGAEGRLVKPRAGGPSFDLTDRYIVVMDDLMTPEEVRGKAREMIARHGIAVEHLYDRAIKGFSSKIPPGLLSRMQSEPGINNILPDGLVEAFCHTGPQVLPTGVNRVEADLSPTANINNIDNRVNADIAIIDTGVYRHADLNVVVAVDCTRRGCPSVTPSDPNSHGTHVAGSAAAIDNTRSVVGVAPGARIWSVRVLNSFGSGFISNIIAGIDFVTRNAASIEVANMSLGGSGSNTPNCGVNSSGQVVDPMHRAICNSVNQGVVYTVAAGNSFRNAANVIPAAYSEVITVSALADSDGRRGGQGPSTSAGRDDTFATFSNFGSVIDLIAPGVNINSTAPGDSANPGGYCQTLSGTSMASPHAAGAVALYLATHPKPVNATQAAAVRDFLRASGECPDGSSFGTTGCATRWSNDPDGITEPLVNVAGF
jgi:subtilisin family serine protease